MPRHSIRISLAGVTMSLAATICAAALLTGAPAAAVPPHPDEITYPPLEFTPPMASEFRRELPSGVPIYLAPSREFPLITLTLTFRGGSYLEGPDEAGFGSALGAMMRSGGTTSVPAKEMDERFDFLAANVSSFVGAEQSGATINCLMSNFDEAFALFLDMVKNPGFDAERLRIQKDQAIEQLKQRNDHPMSVAMVEMGEMIWGADHYSGRKPTLASVEAMSPESLRRMHARIFHPGNLIISATGDFEPVELMSKLDAAITGWEIGPTAGDPPVPTKVLEPGLYHAEVSQRNLPQGTTLIVSRSITRDDPDEIPMSVMNHILGGGGFTSRVLNRVRSDEGLAYSAATFIQPQVYYPGVFGAFFQSKNRTVALATKIVFEEIERIRTEPVTDEELETAKNAFIEQLPQRFASKATTLGVLVFDELSARDRGYWQTYRDRVRQVTAADVQRVASEHLSPEKMAILVIGDWDAIYAGDLEGRASMQDFFNGDVRHLPVRDPLTLEPK